jgi:hypothetical protein
MAVFKANDQPLSEADCATNLANLYNMLDDPKSAIRTVSLARKVYESSNVPVSLAKSSICMARSYRCMDQVEKANELLGLAKEIYEAKGLEEFARTCEEEMSKK